MCIRDRDGTDEYKASCQDVTIIISTDCTVTFEPNGGTAVPSQTVRYGETVEPVSYTHLDVYKRQPTASTTLTTA